MTYPASFPKAPDDEPDGHHHFLQEDREIYDKGKRTARGGCFHQAKNIQKSSAEMQQDGYQPQIEIQRGTMRVAYINAYSINAPILNMKISMILMAPCTCTSCPARF